VVTAEGRFLDFCHGWGAAVLGWADPEVEAAAAATSGSARDLSARLAALLPYAESAVFRASFPRLLADALAGAKAFTGRDTAWFCDFAGRLDLAHAEALIAEAPGGVAALVIDTLDAAPATLADLRRLADRTGAVLIFDESRTALRAHAAGACGLSGVEPDLALLGAALANGRPIAAVAGRRAVLDAVPAGDAPEPAAFAAACATLDRTERVDAIAAVRVAGAEIGAELDAALRATGADTVFRIEGDPSWLRLVVRPDAAGAPDAMSAFVEAALYDAGVIAPSAFIPAWTTGGREIAELVAAASVAFEAAVAASAEGRFEPRARVRRAG
jgi:glutamate-1-semialdehyde aminotransferase